MKRILIVIITIILITGVTGCEAKNDYNQNPYNTKQIETPKEVQKKIYKSINFITQGGTTISSQKVEQGSQLNTPPTTYKEDHIFDGWYLDQNYTQGAIFPMTINNDVTLYAKWLKIKDVIGCEGCNIDSDLIHTRGYSYNLTPTGLDLDRLSLLGYRINVTVNYNVYYEKDYNVPFDIGYMGSPKYEISIIDNNKRGEFQENMSTSKTPESRSISKSYTPLEIKNNNIRMEISSDNIQNKIYFTDIIITYTCVK